MNSGFSILISAQTEKLLKRKGKTWVASSGGFDPVHIGHIRMFEHAKLLGDVHIVILNNDNWLRAKKRTIFMQQEERLAVIKSLRTVDGVLLTSHMSNTEDLSVNQAIEDLRPDVFVNGGDRKLENIPETDVCNKFGIKMEFNVGAGGKIQSSSWLLSNYQESIKII